MRFRCCDFAEWVWKVSGTEGEQNLPALIVFWGSGTVGEQSI